MEELIKQLRNISKALFLVCIICILFANTPNLQIKYQNAVNELILLKKGMFPESWEGRESYPIEYISHALETYEDRFYDFARVIKRDSDSLNINVAESFKIKGYRYFQVPEKTTQLDTLFTFFRYSGAYHHYILKLDVFVKQIKEFSKDKKLGLVNEIKVEHPANGIDGQKFFPNYKPKLPKDSLLVKYSFENTEEVRELLLPLKKFRHGAFMGKSQIAWIPNSRNEYLKSFLSGKDSIKNVFASSRLVWNEIKTMNTEEAITWLQDKANESNKGLSFLGLSIPSISSSFFGTLTILFILLYILVHLTRANEINSEEEIDPNKLLWLPLFSSKLAFYLSFIIIALLPFFSSGFLLSPQIKLIQLGIETDISFYFGILFSILNLVFGVLAWKKILLLRNKLNINAILSESISGSETSSE